MSEHDEKWRTVADLAEELQVAEATIVAWIQQGELEAVNAARRPNAQRKHWRIPPSAIRAFRETRSNLPHDAPPAARRRRKPAPPQYV